LCQDGLESTSGERSAKLASVALNAIPVVGGFMSSIANEIIAKRQNRRLNEFLLELAEKMQDLDEKLNQKFIQSEDFRDLAEDIFSKASETRQKEKLEAFKALFLNTILSDKPNYDEASEIAIFVDRRQPRHIIMLKILSDPKKADNEMGELLGKGSGLATSILSMLKILLPNWDDEQIERTWQELYDDRIHRTDGVKTMMTDKGIRQLENRLSEFGKKVASYLKEPD
jgi:hypothetical protein